MAVPAPAPAGDLAYDVRRSARARRVRVTVDPGGRVEVVLPRRTPQRAATEAVVELRPWIDRRLAEAAAVRERLAARAGTVPYLGQTLRLVPQEGRTRVHRHGEVLHVPCGDARPALERWYRRAARSEVTPRLDVAVAALGTAYTRLTIRDQRTRWGSCSAQGAIAINWRLLLAPPEVLDYVVWHEACHLVVHDHSPDFWALVHSKTGDQERCRSWLHINGMLLTL
ncbi:MAG TPA: SprT family zinc-dependent metalloprotease [Solirubrobacteraceae bacterium]|nr:SprT family zinc-dependent metalloprotease [Solirubrobacteraceae bacterium]